MTIPKNYLGFVIVDCQTLLYFTKDPLLFFTMSISTVLFIEAVWVVSTECSLVFLYECWLIIFLCKQKKRKNKRFVDAIFTSSFWETYSLNHLNCYTLLMSNRRFATTTTQPVTSAQQQDVSLTFSNLGKQQFLLVVLMQRRC